MLKKMLPRFASAHCRIFAFLLIAWEQSRPPTCHPKKHSSSSIFCQGEAKELAANAALFGGAHILWVSAAESKQIREFGAWYGLAHLPSYTLSRDSLRSFGQTFSTASVPTTFVYSALRDGKRSLLKQFTGETSAEAIRKAIGQ